MVEQDVVATACKLQSSDEGEEFVGKWSQGTSKQTRNTSSDMLDYSQYIDEDD